MIRPTPEHFGTYDESEYPHLWSGRVGAWCPSIQPPGGSRVWDYSTSQSFGRLVNGWFQVSRGQQEVSLTGSFSGIEIDGGRFYGDSRGSISLWVRFAAINQTASVFATATVGAVGSEYRIDVNAGTFRVVAFDNPTVLIIADSSFTASTLEWIHCVVTSNGTTIAMWINGQQTTLSNPGYSNTGQWFASLSNITGAAIAGIRRSSMTIPFWGGVDDCSIYNRALSGGEIRELFLLGRAGAYTPRSRHFYPQSFAQTSRLLQLRRSHASC